MGYERNCLLLPQRSHKPVLVPSFATTPQGILTAAEGMMFFYVFCSAVIFGNRSHCL
jgi:hypothetical protein